MGGNGERTSPPKSEDRREEARRDVMKKQRHTEKQGRAWKGKKRNGNGQGERAMKMDDGTGTAESRSNSINWFSAFNS